MNQVGVARRKAPCLRQGVMNRTLRCMLRIVLKPLPWNSYPLPFLFLLLLMGYTYTKHWENAPNQRLWRGTERSEVPSPPSIADRVGDGTHRVPNPLVYILICSWPDDGRRMVRVMRHFQGHGEAQPSPAAQRPPFLALDSTLLGRLLFCKLCLGRERLKIATILNLYLTFLIRAGPNFHFAPF